ncbi:MAG TPA: HAF repeat-containing protein [Candidatus Dormibacteraeota bacterium]|nr:HAF repeat-containing protein [Candidatus Dormibacteraeota bacterium]
MSRIASIGAMLVLALSALAVGQTYHITDLGVLKGDNESSGFWINNLGEVAGCSDMQTSFGYPCTGLVPGQHAFYWTQSGGMKDLGTLSGATVSGAIGVNDSGTVVGYSNVKGQLATDFVAVQWSSTGAITNLGTLSGGASSAAFQINSAAEVAGDSFLSNGKVNATSWTNTKIKNLGALKGSIFTAGLAINDSGEIVGESVFGYGPPFTSHGFLWNGSTMTDLGTLSGGVTSMANAINTAGVIAGQSDGSSTSGHWHAVKWNSSGKIQDLGVLGGGTYSIAFGINDSNVVVGYANTSDNSAHAMVWTSSGGMQDLNSLIPATSGWTLINANAINNVGQITGYGSKNGHNHAFVLTPVN